MGKETKSMSTKSPTAAHTCCESVREPGTWPRFHSCGRTAKVEVDGKWYCGIHDPVKRKAKRKAYFRKAMATIYAPDYAALKASHAELMKRLQTSMVAIDDWLHLYAPELCGEEHVRETHERIDAAGAPLAYIAETQEENRKALAAAEVIASKMGGHEN